MSEIKPVSEKQLKWLRQFKVPEDIIKTLNSKSASDILSSKFGDEDKPQFETPKEDKVPVVKIGEVAPNKPYYVDNKQKPVMSLPTKTYPKDPVGLAVDIFCVLNKEIDLIESNMKIAIDLVKQAQKAFE